MKRGETMFLHHLSSALHNEHKLYLFPSAFLSVTVLLFCACCATKTNMSYTVDVSCYTALFCIICDWERRKGQRSVVVGAAQSNV